MVEVLQYDLDEAANEIIEGLGLERLRVPPGLRVGARISSVPTAITAMLVTTEHGRPIDDDAFKSPEPELRISFPSWTEAFRFAEYVTISNVIPVEESPSKEQSQKYIWPASAKDLRRGSSLNFLIVTVPDRIRSGLSLMFDRNMASLQSAVQTQPYLFVDLICRGVTGPRL